MCVFIVGRVFGTDGTRCVPTKTVYHCGSHFARVLRPAVVCPSRSADEHDIESARRRRSQAAAPNLQTRRYSPRLNRGCIISARAMNQPDPGLPLNCPTCGKPLRYVATKLSPATWYLYICPQDGLFEFPKDGRPSPTRHRCADCQLEDSLPVSAEVV
jgi:hypothetical protein